MKRFTLLTLLLVSFAAQLTYARNGYRIQVKFTDVKDSILYLAHYYGKPLPTIYKIDSARFDKNGVATLKRDSTVLGGIYLVLLSDKKTYFELLLNNGDDMSVTASAATLPAKLKFKNSPENDRFIEYMDFLKTYSTEQQEMEKGFATAKTKSDSNAVRQKLADHNKELNKFRADYAAKYPGTLLANIFKTLAVPQVPEGPHYLPDGKTVDSTFAYTYYKGHYWDGFPFQDDRIINTPIYDGKLDDYMNRFVLQMTDSVEKEADMLLAKTKGTTDMFKYTLWWLTRYVENSKVMGMDEVFVYLVENYYMKGYATWLSPEELSKYTDRASKIAPNVIGNLAPEVKLPEVKTKKTQSLHQLQGKYTLLVFWSPDCGHCLTEVPKLDSVYKAVLKKKGMKIYSVATEGDDKKITEIIDKNKLDDWIVTWDPERTSDYRSKYDVYSTPTIYLLDEKKIIRGKRIDHSNLADLVEMLEKKETAKNKK